MTNNPQTPDLTITQAQGVQLLELGALDTHTAAGLARFKLGSGAMARKLGGTWIRLSP